MGVLMRRQSEAWLLLILLPIFCVGMVPILLVYFLGFVGLGIAGILFICVGLGDTLRANGDFNREAIVGGYMRPSYRAFHKSNLQSAGRFAAAVSMAGGGLIAAAIVGVFWFS